MDRPLLRFITIHTQIKHIFIDEWCGEKSMNANIGLKDLLYCYDSGRLSGIWITLHRGYFDDKMSLIESSDRQEFQKQFYMPTLKYNLRNSKEISEETKIRLPFEELANDPRIGKAMVDGITPKNYQIDKANLENDLKQKFRDSLRYCSQERLENRIVVVLPWGSSTSTFIGSRNVENITMREIIMHCKNTAHKCYVYFNKKNVSNFISQLKDPSSSSDTIQSSDISSYVTTDPIQFLSNDNQDGILVTDADSIEGCEFRTVISLFAQKFHSTGPSSVGKTQINLFLRAIANLVAFVFSGEETGIY